MAATVKAHDTYPPLRFKVEDEDGLIDLTPAQSIKLILIGPTTVQGAVDVLDPPDTDGFNAKFEWGQSGGESDLPGLYHGEIEITWGPGAIETVPNSGTFQLVIESDLG